MVSTCRYVVHVIVCVCKAEFQFSSMWGGTVISCQAQHREGSSIATGQPRCVASSWAVSQRVYVLYESLSECVYVRVPLCVSIFCGPLAGCALYITWTTGLQVTAGTVLCVMSLNVCALYSSLTYDLGDFSVFIQ